MSAIWFLISYSVKNDTVKTCTKLTENLIKIKYHLSLENIELCQKIKKNVSLKTKSTRNRTKHLKLLLSLMAYSLT